MVIGLVASIATLGSLLNNPAPHQVTLVDRSPLISASGSLIPAPFPPRGPLCIEPVTVAADYTVKPLFCLDGAINAVAWRDLSAVPLLGTGIATLDDVTSQMCYDLRDVSMGVETQAYELSAAYYGWRFNADPLKAVRRMHCPPDIAPSG